MSDDAKPDGIVDRSKAEPSEKPSKGAWWIAFAVATLPVLFCFWQVGIFFDEAYPHLYWSRTLAAWVAVALGVAGILIPLSLIWKRQTFARRSSHQQWLSVFILAAVMVFCYLGPFLFLVDLARHTRAILSYTPAAYLHYSSKDQEPKKFLFTVVGGRGTGSGGSDGTNGHLVIYWDAWVIPKELAPPDLPEPKVHLEADIQQADDKYRIDVTVETGRKIRFETRGLTGFTAERDGQAISLPMELDPGVHRIQLLASSDL